MNATSKQLLEFYPEPNSGATGLSNNNYLSFQDREINKYQYTQRMDFVQSSASSWMGRYSYGKEDELTPALKLNGTKLNTSVHQVAVGNTRTLSSSVVNEARFGFNYFFNTFGRELAFERDVVKELAIPGISLNPPEAWGIPSIGITGFSGFGDSTEGPYTNRNKAFEFSDNVTWIRGRHSFKVGGTIRYDMFNQVGNQFARGNFQFQNIATGYAFADYMLGYTQQTEAAVALAVTKFRALSQSYYFTDTWKVRSNMTFDLGLRYEYTPPWLDKNGTLMNADIPCHDTTPNVQNRACHPTLVRIGSGDVYEDTVLRFAPNIQVARDGRLGDRLVFDDKKNFAPRIGWAWNPSEKWSFRAGTGIFYMQDTGNPRFDMARNLSGRRRDNTLLLTPDLTFEAPFRGAGAGGTNDCGVAPPLVCLTNVYVLGNMPNRKTPYMLQYLFNVQRELGSSTALEVGYLGSRSYRLERMFDWNETIPGVTGSVQSRKPYPEFTKVQEIGNVAEAKYNSLAVKLTRRLHDGLSVLGGYTLSKSTDNGSGIRTLNGDTLFPQDSFCLAVRVGAVGLRRAPSVCRVGPLRVAVRRREAVPAERHRRGDPRRVAAQHDRLDIERVSENGVRRHRPVQYRRRSGPSERHGSRIRICRPTSDRSRAGSTPRRSRCRRRAPGATPAATRSSARASTRWICRSSATSRSRAIACSSGSRRSTRSTTRSGTTRTRR